MHRENYKKLVKRLNNYRKYYGDVICALIKDSSVRSKNRSYVNIKEKLKRDGFKVLIVDIAKEHPIHEIA